MDPLSVIASVAGIATAAGEVIKILRPYTTAAKDAPVIAAEVSSEALATQTIIIGLEQLISNFSAANVRYASLIQVDQLTAVLFDGVKIFSELLAVLQTLPPLEPSSPGGSLWTPIQWVRKKSSLTTMLHKLRAFKSSIVCILSILQSDSLARAEESQQQLIAAVDMLLRDNSDLSRRMMGMENIVDTMSHRRATIQSTKDIDAQKGKATSSQRSSLFEFDFEHDLKLSRVYRHAKRDTMDFSARSSVARTHAWSSLSGISLSDISHISVLALPLLGIPLLMLFDQLDSSNHERWEHLIASNPSGEVSKLAITEFLKACMKCPTISPSQLVTDTDILLDDTTCHVKKVISLVRLLLASLTKAGMIQAIVFESAPNIFAVEPNPASLAVDAFLCDERLYLKRLEILFETVKEIRSFRNLPIDSFDSMFAPIGPLINVQTKFLIKAEILASKPYSQQSWQLPFQEWALHSSTYYATLITGQAETKSMIRAALSLADVRDVERRGALGDFLTILGLPSQQLDKYDAFLKEITQYGFHQPDHIDSAKRSLNLVKEAVNKANITQELNHARAALSKDQDYETNKALWGLGKLLMYDKVDIVDARQEDSRQEKFVTAESCQEFDPSKYDPYCRMCVIDDGFASIDVIDATGQEDYSAMRQQFIREGAGFMLVYNVTSRRSFEEITTYYHQILKQKDEDHFPVVIVGIDRFQESLREVMTREGESLAEELGCTFVEVDAKSSDEVDGAFFDLVREVRWYRRDLRGY
ncbi:hypothetical protein FPRO05_11296 [Fusarium proliferatum]|uniref:DH domain-containing protein n=1 Tax=Gibberella intermedia TaxID=948311 RepID=A0A365N9U5_GIBIN|nr:hypothetical protein FPRO05_11296 [Fusarium proliferatum]